MICKKCVSIIVPIYNVADQLSTCIESIQSQDLRDIEIILVDDGSTDGCSQICDEYAALDERIIVIHKKNAGLVEARKTGVQAASGKYIGYVDGDDYIEPDMYRRMYQLAEQEQADIVAVGFTRESASGDSEVYRNFIKNGTYTGAELNCIYENMLYAGNYYHTGIFPSVWSKLFRASILKECQSDVPGDIQMGEDVACTYPALMMADKIVIDNSNVAYHYRYVPSSMTASVDTIYFERMNRLVSFMKQSFGEVECLQRQLEYYQVYLIDLQMKLIWRRKRKESFSNRKRNMQDLYHREDLLPNYRMLDIPTIVKIQGYVIKHRMFLFMPFIIAIEKRVLD